MKIDVVAVNMNAIRRMIAEASAFSKNEFKTGFSNFMMFCKSPEAPNPEAEPETRRYDTICKLKNNVLKYIN